MRLRSAGEGDCKVKFGLVQADLFLLCSGLVKSQASEILRGETSVSIADGCGWQPTSAAKRSREIPLSAKLLIVGRRGYTSSVRGVREAREMSGPSPEQQRLAELAKQIEEAEKAIAKISADLPTATASANTLGGLERDAKLHVSAIEKARKSAETGKLAKWTLFAALLSALTSSVAAGISTTQLNRTTANNKLTFAMRVNGDFHTDVSALIKEPGALTAFSAKDPTGKIDVKAVPVAPANRLIDLFNDYVAIRRFNNDVQLMDKPEWDRNTAFICKTVARYPGAFDFLSAEVDTTDQIALEELKSCL